MSAEQEDAQSLGAPGDGNHERTQLLQELRELADHSQVAQWLITPAGLLLRTNRAAERLTGPWKNRRGRPLWDAPWITAVQARIQLEADVLKAAGGVPVSSQLMDVRPARQEAGERLSLGLLLTPILREGQVHSVLLEGHPVTGREELEYDRLFLEAVLENVQDGVVACDAQGKLTIFNRTSREMHGIADLPSAPGGALDPDGWADAYDLFEENGVTRLATADIPLVRAWRGEVVQGLEIVIAPRALPARTVESYGKQLRANDGTLLGAVVAMHDVTQRRATVARLRHDALHDPLTGLPNRALLHNRLEMLLERFHRHPEQPYAVLFLDLDDFKTVNDVFGHLAGDRLLLETAARLKDTVRTTDTVARLGGDEFAVLLDSPCDGIQAMQIAGRLQEAMAVPIRLVGREVKVQCSIGVVAAAEPYTRVEELLRDADTAMYRAKALGKHQAVLFAPEMHETLRERLNTETQLLEALRSGQFELHYQPVVELQSGSCVALEALVRWRHPVRGLLSPAAFLDVAQQAGLMVPLGQWVLGEAARQVQAWRLDPLLARLGVTVNVSAEELQCRGNDAPLLQTFPFPPGMALELIETQLLDTPETIRTLDHLHQLGVPLMLDDFGTGFASLRIAQDVPIGTLKLDRSFVAELPGEGRQRAVFASVMTLAAHLGVPVIAEGLETPAQLAAATALGCRYGQGYHFARPLPLAEALVYARSHPASQTEALLP